MADIVKQDMGVSTAYGAAVLGGYTGTYADFCRQQAGYAENAELVEESRAEAVSAAESANRSKEAAAESMTAAEQSASSAGGSALSAEAAAERADVSAVNAEASETAAGLSASAAGEAEAAAAESAEEAAESAAALRLTIEDVARLDVYQKLLQDDMPGTTQEYAFMDGAVSTVTHKAAGTAVRTDSFTYGANSITEVRTLASGDQLTILTDLTTLETTVTFTAA